ncbi:16S rRNA (adenine(1408)-N(1))-methyltransferase [Anaerobacterium chartisolvens]|uniref:16S rRNA (Adenine(1408)-N(1))-methyltransferase n=2 Tax=Anaerobacterium chartisolvens TaxID=1297424 RepID=A0A369ALS9_9FIRM|nr:16S rRNA (adenine(1408)-N(1))-methyltransferase [Anaerobacterium chartisolvens]
MALRILKGKKIIEQADLSGIAEGFDSIAVDIGTGDGRFVYNLAKKNPGTLFIGLDPAAENMFEYSSRIIKKPSKGGLPNVLYVVSNIEELPDELSGAADNIYINLPWGSLLEGVVKASDHVLCNVVRLAKPPEASLEMCFTYSELHELGEMDRRELPELSLDYIRETLVPLYHEKGIEIKQLGTIDNQDLREHGTQWAKRLGFGRSREVYRISAAINKK